MSRLTGSSPLDPSAQFAVTAARGSLARGSGRPLCRGPTPVAACGAGPSSVARALYPVPMACARLRAAWPGSASPQARRLTRPPPLDPLCFVAHPLSRPIAHPSIRPHPVVRATAPRPRLYPFVPAASPAASRGLWRNAARDQRTPRLLVTVPALPLRRRRAVLSRRDVPSCCDAPRAPCTGSARVSGAERAAMHPTAAPQRERRAPQRERRARRQRCVNTAARLRRTAPSYRAPVNTSSAGTASVSTASRRAVFRNASGPNSGPRARARAYVASAPRRAEPNQSDLSRTDLI